MDTAQLSATIAAVIIGNAVTVLFIIGAIAIMRLQSRFGLKDDELPLWTYAAVIPAPLLFSVGLYFWVIP